MARTKAIAKSNFARSVGPKVCVRCDTPADLAEWIAWTGRKPDYVHAFVNPTTWAGAVTATKQQVDMFKGQPLAWAFPLATGTQGSAGQPPTQTTTPAQIVAGLYDAHIDLCLEMMLAHNPTGIIPLRLGWEPGNLTAYPWGATTTIPNAASDYQLAFRYIAAKARKKSTSFLIGFCNGYVSYRHSDGAEVDPFDPVNGWNPGTDHWDYLGIDAYLIGIDVSNALTLDLMSMDPDFKPMLVKGTEFGIRHMLDYARANNKLVVFDEWGAGANRPDYIHQMATLFRDPGNNVWMWGYWNKQAGNLITVNDDGATYQEVVFPTRASDDSNNYPDAKAAILEEFFGGPPIKRRQPLTWAYFARCRVGYLASESLKDAIDEFFYDIRVGGMLPYMAWGFFHAAPHINGDNRLGRINMFGAGGFSTSTPRTVGRLQYSEGSNNTPPTITSLRGVKGDGTRYSALRGMSINMLNALNKKFDQDNLLMGAWMLTAVSKAGNTQSHDLGVPTALIGRNGTGDRWIGRPSSGTTVTLTNAGQDAGNVAFTRTSGTDWAGFFNGVATGRNQSLQAAASAALSNDDVRFGAVPGIGDTGGGANEIAFSYAAKNPPAASGINAPLVIHNAAAKLLTATGVLI